MKNVICICSILIFVNLHCQKGIYNLLKLSNKVNQDELILENYNRYYYAPLELKKFDENAINIKDNPNLVLAVIDSVIFSNQLYELKQTNFFDFISTQLKIKYDENGRIVESLLIFPKDSSLNEVRTYDFDSSGRLIKSIFKGKRIEDNEYIEKNILIQFFYANDIFPDSIYLFDKVNVKILKEIKDDTFIYKYKIDISNELKSEYESKKNIIGIQLSKELEIYRKYSNRYSKIFLTKDELYKEEIYNKEFSDDHINIETTVFDKNFKIIKNFEPFSNFEYRYTKSGKIESIILNDEVSQKYEYDDNNNLIKETTRFYINKLTYKNGKIDNVYKYDLDKNLLEYSEFKFF